jgi:hypothetical protein
VYELCENALSFVKFLVDEIPKWLEIVKSFVEEILKYPEMNSNPEVESGWSEAESGSFKSELGPVSTLCRRWKKLRDLTFWSPKPTKCKRCLENSYEVKGNLKYINGGVLYVGIMYNTEID